LQEFEAKNLDLAMNLEVCKD